MKPTPRFRIGRIIATTILSLLTFNLAHAQINFSAGSPYTQDFDTALAAAGAWAENSTMPGWYASKSLPAGGAVVAAFSYGDGSSNSGQIWSFGVEGVHPIADRAMGSIGSGTPGNFAYGMRFANDTALTITNITVSYTGEEWRNSGNTSVQPLAFSYRKSGTPITSSDAVGTQVWTPFSGLTFNSPTVGATLTKLDGNDPTNRTALTATLTGVTVGPGEEIFLRWFDLNDAGNDHGLAVDDLSITWETIAPNNNPPTISQQPVNATNYAGNNVQFSVQANGKAPLMYQWYYTNAGNNVLISGATASALALSTITNDNAGQYYVIITNDVPGAITSSVVTLKVLPAVVTNIAYLHTLQDNVNFALTDPNTLYQITGIVTTPNLVSGGIVYSFYIQDATGGIDVFERGGFAALGQLPSDLPLVGQVVTVTAPLAQFNGAIEVSPIAANPAYSLVLSNNDPTIYPLPAPKVLDFASLANSALMETNYEGSRVIVSNVSLDQTLGVFTAAATTTVVMTNASLLTMPLFNSVGATDSQGQAIPAFAYSVTGVVLQNKSSAPYTGSYQIALNLYADINVTPPAGPPVLTLLTSGSTLTLTWTGSPVLQSSTNVAGPYVTVPDAASPFVTNGAASSTPVQFFRLYLAP